MFLGLSLAETANDGLLARISGRRKTQIGRFETATVNARRPANVFIRGPSL